MELGYERVKVGPTSNFVGNHMTQGAIDLVQAQLDLCHRAALLKLDAGDTGRPQLLQTAALSAQPSLEAATFRKIHVYHWSDDGSKVTLDIPVQQMELGDDNHAAVTCKFTASELDLQAVVRSNDPCASPAPQRYRLLVSPLHASVLPHACHCYSWGTPGLPAPRHSGSGTAMPERSTAVNKSDRVQQPTSDEQVVSFTLPNAAASLVVQLVKEDHARRWEALQQTSESFGNSGAIDRRPDVSQLR